MHARPWLNAVELVDMGDAESISVQQVSQKYGDVEGAPGSQSEPWAPSVVDRFEETETSGDSLCRECFKKKS
jgi:hypothetical protein